VRWSGAALGMKRWVVVSLPGFPGVVPEAGAVRGREVVSPFRCSEAVRGRGSARVFADGPGRSAR
jgi:hypothetical protein